MVGGINAAFVAADDYEAFTFKFRVAINGRCVSAVFKSRYPIGCGLLELPGRPNQVLGSDDSFVDLNMEFIADLLYVDHVCVAGDR